MLGSHMWLVATILESGAEFWTLLTEGETPITGSLRKGCFYCIKNEVLPARPLKKKFFFFFSIYLAVLCLSCSVWDLSLASSDSLVVALRLSCSGHVGS